MAASDSKKSEQQVYKAYESKTLSYIEERSEWSLTPMKKLERELLKQSSTKEYNASRAWHQQTIETSMLTTIFSIQKTCYNEKVDYEDQIYAHQANHWATFVSVNYTRNAELTYQLYEKAYEVLQVHCTDHVAYKAEVKEKLEKAMVNYDIRLQAYTGNIGNN